jgi:hypothetical protein
LRITPGADRQIQWSNPGIHSKQFTGSELFGQSAINRSAVEATPGALPPGIRRRARMVDMAALLLAMTPEPEE